MSDPLAHVGPSQHYLRGYEAALITGRGDCPHAEGTFEASEWEEGYYDGLADLAALNDYSEAVH